MVRDPALPRSEDDAGEKLHVSEEETATHTPADLSVEQARQGHTGDHVRYILGASFIGGFLLLLLIFWISTQ
jgi:hypothetical protein